MHACEEIGMGVASLVSEILFLFDCCQKQLKFPFRQWTIVHMGIKNRP